MQTKLLDDESTAAPAAPAGTAPAETEAPPLIVPNPTSDLSSPMCWPAVIRRSGRRLFTSARLAVEYRCS